MLRLISKTPEIVAPYSRQAELERLIIFLVCKYQGLRESDLWLYIMSEMDGENSPSMMVIAGTIHRMIRHGRLTGIDYEYGEISNTFVLPAHTHTAIHIPIEVVREPPLTMLN